MTYVIFKYCFYHIIIVNINRKKYRDKPDSYRQMPRMREQRSNC